MRDRREIEVWIKLMFARPSAASKLMWRYLSVIDRKYLSSKRPDRENGINHCVYEERISKNTWGYESTLEELLRRTGWCSERGIIVIDAPANGYAKDYLADRLMTLCYDFLVGQSIKYKNFFKLERVLGNGFYIPIRIREDAIGDFGEEDNLERLSAICVKSIELEMREEGEKWRDKDSAKLSIFISYMLQKGKIFLGLSRGCLEKRPDLQDLIINEFSKGKNRASNMAVYVVDEDRDFCNGQYCYFIKLEKLSRDEILSHINFIIKEDANTAEFFEKLLEENEQLQKELQIPERLLLLSKVHEEKIQQNNISIFGEELKQIKNVVQFYDFIIHNCIELCIRNTFRVRVGENTSTVIYRALKEVAWSKIESIKDEKIWLNAIDERFWHSLENQNKKTQKDNQGIWKKLVNNPDFLVDDKKKFSFIGCEHYLVALNLFEKLQESNRSAKTALCNPIFLEKSNSQIFLFLIDIIKDKIDDEGIKEQYFNIIWSSITDDRISGEYNRVQVLADVLKRYGRMRDITYINKFIEFILTEISRQYYDINVFDAIHRINEECPELDINRNLRERYQNLRRIRGTSPELIDNQKRRLSYYFGKERCDIPEAAVADLVDRNVHLHVKYHIILAIIENYIPSNLRQMRKLLNRYDKRIAACESDWKEDCILYSDYLLLRSKRDNMERGYGPEERELQRRLVTQLGEGEYWKRAHAAGALGRQGLDGSVNNLQQQLRREIENILNDRNSLKAVSYIVEAICEIFYRLNEDIKRKGEEQERRAQYQASLEECVKIFTNLISLNNQKGVEESGQDGLLEFFVIFATLSEGIIYLMENVNDRMPEEFGKHIKEGKKDLKSKYRTILMALSIVEDKIYTETENIRQKRCTVEEIYNRLDETKSFFDSTADEKDLGNIPNTGPIDTQIINFYLDRNNKNDDDDSKGGVKVKVVNKGEVKNQQIVGDNATGNFYAEGKVDIREDERIKEIEKIIAANCQDRLKEELHSIVSEMCNNINNGNAEAKKSSVWLEKMRVAISTFGSIVTISNAPWWQGLKMAVENLINSL